MVGQDSLDKRVDLPEKFILTDEFKNIFDQMENTKTNLFITGKAGCGKSTLLEYFRQKTKKNLTLIFTKIQMGTFCDEQ